MKAYIYVTAKRPYLCYQDYERTDRSKNFKGYKLFDASYKKCSCNGKVVASFELRTIVNLSDEYAGKPKDSRFYGILRNACLTVDELEKYCPTNSGKKAFAWHIDNLEIFEKPWTLKSFMSVDTTYPGWEEDWRPLNEITKAPQSWMYAIAYYEDGNCEPCLLISINSQWACKILNGEKTIEIRKSAPRRAAK